MREIKFRAWNGKRLCDVYTIEPFNHRCQTAEGWVDIDNLEQYTGLKDRKGKEIYEGDIVYIAGKGNCIVKWSTDLLAWTFNTDVDEMDYQWVIEDVERVIGNIHENRELLEEK